MHVKTESNSPANLRPNWNDYDPHYVLLYYAVTTIIAVISMTSSIISLNAYGNP